MPMFQTGWYFGMPETVSGGGSLPLWPAPPLQAQNAARLAGGGWPQSATLSETTETETLESRLAQREPSARSVADDDSTDRVRAATLARRRYIQMATHAAVSTAAATPAETPMATACLLSTIPAARLPVPPRRGNEHAVRGRR
nr:unnamed protein product [Digitaria exilis]